MAYTKLYLNAATIADQIRTGEYQQTRKMQSENSDISNALIRRPQKEETQDTFKPMSPEEMAAHYMNLVSYDDIGSDFGEGTSGIGGSYTSEQGSFSTKEKYYSGYEGLTGLIDAKEGGGDYNALLGFSNNDTFSNIKVSEMTIGELKAFSNGAYAQFSKGQVGRKATPMGRYQIVGETLADTANKLGLDDNTVFSPAVQDEMFAYLADTAYKENGLSGLRSKWVGLKSVPDDALKSAMDQFQSNSSIKPKENPLKTRIGK